MPSVYLGLGSNLGDRQGNIATALELISKFARVVRTSSLYETEPVGFLDQPRFLNAVCEIKTRIPPVQLLVLLKGIEVNLGRTISFRNAPRTVDIDVLLYDDIELTTRELVIPHPRLAERAFVLAPLAELSPTLVHPTLKKTAAQLLEEVAGKDGVRLWTNTGGN